MSKSLAYEGSIDTEYGVVSLTDVLGPKVKPRKQFVHCPSCGMKAAIAGRRGCSRCGEWLG